MSTSSRGFSVAHQRVGVEVDILGEQLKGSTELTVVPTTKELKSVILDARRLTIEKCYINGIEAKFDYKDLLTDPPVAPRSWTVEQYRLYRTKLQSLINQTGEAPGELVIHLPEEVEITEPNDATFMASHSSKEKSYEPLTVRVFYRTNNPSGANLHNDGLHFATSKKEEAHVYTTHAPIGQATSCWLPCADGLWSLSTWELEFRIPQLLDEADPDSELLIACNNTMPNEEPDPQNEKNKIVKFDIFTPVSSQHIGFAIGPFKAIPINQEKKKDDNSMPGAAGGSNMGGAGPAGFANGGFPHGSGFPNGSNGMGPNGGPNGFGGPGGMPNPGMPDSAGFPAPVTSSSGGSSSGNTDRDQKQIMAFVLPSKAKLVSHTCAVFPKAMKYLVDHFGTPLFDSYSLCFVGDYPGGTSYTGDAFALTVLSDSLLYDPAVIEPRFEYIEVLIRSLAAQWCGVSIVPASWKDLWLTEGISLYMTSLFIRKLMGNNEFRFRMKRGNDRLCEEDIEMPPLGAPRFRFPLMPEDLSFVRMKAPLVLFILDRRMTKTDRSFGVARVLSKLFMQSMSGDLRSQLSTSHFMRQCEKIAHYRLQRFFDEWIYGSGFPIFRITQRFNKKRTCIEMGIAQVHSRELPKEVLNNKTFLSKAITELREAEKIEEEKATENLLLLRELAGVDDEFAGDTTITHNPRINGVGADGLHGNGTARDANGNATPTPRFIPVPHFFGPMTIRIHEANGTPYEHVVDLRDQFTKIDIPYNTKYKRLRRNQKFRKSTAFKDGTFPMERPGMPGFDAFNNGMMNEEKLINCLGDVLMSDYEVASWQFVDWGDGDEEEEVMFNEAFEWLRADADFEWLGQFFVSQPDYMYASQLQQDRDVVAQYDAVRYFGRQQPNPIYGTVLTRTIMDARYYYGVRVAAVEELRKLAIPQVEYIGMRLLLRIFRELYCLGDSKLPRANDFRNFPSYFVQKKIPQVLCLIRDEVTGRCPIAICNFILDLIRHNENSENLFSDSYYIASLLESAANSVRPTDIESGELVVRGAVVNDITDDPEYHQFLSSVVAEIDKCQRLDQWVPSPYHIVTTTAIKIEELLIMAGYGQPRLDKLLLATEPNEAPEVRLAAISSLLNLGAYRSSEIMQYLLDMYHSEASYVMHNGIYSSIASMLGIVAMYGECVAAKINEKAGKSSNNSKSSSNDSGSTPGGMRSARQQMLARQSVQKAIPVLRDTLKNAEPLKLFVWTCLNSPQTGSFDRRLVLEICELLYEPKARLIATMKAPPLFEVGFKRKKDYVMVAKYRSVLKKPKTHAAASVKEEEPSPRFYESTPQPEPAAAAPMSPVPSPAPPASGSQPVKLKLKLK